MKATLYQFMTSPFCSKVRKILDYKGIDYQIVEVDYVERKELIAASGQIMVPALRLEEVGGSGDAGAVGPGGTPAPVTVVRTVVVGGMPGWQIALIAVVAALFTAIAAVLVERSRTARRRPVRPLTDASL